MGLRPCAHGPDTSDSPCISSSSDLGRPRPTRTVQVLPTKHVTSQRRMFADPLASGPGADGAARRRPPGVPGTGAHADGPRSRLDIRRYRSEDAALTRDVFDQAIRRTASAFYTQSQLDAWNPGSLDLDQWDQHRTAAWTVVCGASTGIAGFADLTADGELNMLYVHPAHASTGVARALVESVLEEARRRGLTEVRTRASRSARPVLEHLGFVIARDHFDNTTRGQVVPNYTMRIHLR